MLCSALTPLNTQKCYSFHSHHEHLHVVLKLHQIIYSKIIGIGFNNAILLYKCIVNNAEII